MSRKRALAELILAAAIWGFGFVAVRFSLESFPPLWLNCLRLLLGFVFGFPLLLIFPSLRKGLNWNDFRLGIVPGFWLGVCLVLQTYGLRLTTIAKSGFITCLYVIMVPPLGRLLYGQRTSMLHYLWVALSLVGAALICQVDSLQVNTGDWLTLACAVAAAFQILEVGRLSRRAQSSFAFTIGQSLWASILPMVGALI